MNAEQPPRSISRVDLGFASVRREEKEGQCLPNAGGREAEIWILEPRPQPPRLEGASVDVGHVPEQGRRRGEERGRRRGGRRRGRRRRRRVALGLGLSVVRWTIGVYAAVVQAHASYQQLLLHRRLMPKLLQPQLILPLPFRSSVLVPSFDLGLGEGQGVGHVAPIRHAQIFLASKLSLEVSELGVGERRPPSSRLPAAWGAAARSARLAGRGRRRRWRERGRGAFQSGAGAASRVDRVLGVRMNGRVVLRIFVHPLGQNIPQKIPYEERLVLLHYLHLEVNKRE